MSYAIPSILRYDMLPSSIGETMERSISPPVTGSIDYHSAQSDYIILQVPKASGGCVFDPRNIFFFQLINKSY